MTDYHRIVRPENLAGFVRSLGATMHRMEGQALSQGGKAAVNFLTAGAHAWPIFDRGFYRSGFRSKVIKRTLEIFQVAKNVNFVDDGRRPGARPPPLQPIREWLARRGKPERLAFVVARAIGKRGIRPRNVYKRYPEQVLGFVTMALERCWDKAARMMP